MLTARERKKRRHSRYCLIPAIGPVVLAFFISPAVPIAGQTEEWHRYKNDRGNFSVLFPIKPKALDTETTLVASGSTTYVVVYQDENFKHVEAVFQTYRDSALNEMAAKTNCELLKKGDPPSLRVRGYFGSLFRGKCAGEKNMNFVGNFYLNQRRSYTVYAIYPTVTSEPPSVTRFMNSFSLIDSSR